jgi:hypothetical protein
MIRLTTILTLLTIPLLGCSDRELGDDDARDIKAPRITIEVPARGTMVPDSQVSVEGHVVDLDSAITEVTVNGIPATVQPDGAFRTLITVPDGLTLIHTVAIDVDGNEGTDTRSVLAGNLVPSRQHADDSLVAHLNRQTFLAMSSAMSGFLSSPELAESLQAANPVLEKGSDCNGIKLNIDDVSIGRADVNIVPVEAGIEFDLSLTNVDVEVGADYDLACLGGSSTIDITADSFTSSGHIKIDLIEDELVVELTRLDSDFDNLDIDFGLLDSDLIEMIVWDMDGIASSAVDGIIRYQFEKFTKDTLADFTSGEFVATVLGEQIKFGILPTIVDFSTEGGLIMADGNVQAVDGKNVGYLSTPTPAPKFGALGDQGFSVAVADDFLNQAFAASWASGAMEKAVAYEKEDSAGSGPLGLPIDKVQVSLLLPPVVSATNPDGVNLVIGDLILDIIRKTGDEEQVVTRLAVSGQLEVSVSTQDSTRLRFNTNEPKLHVDFLEDGVTGSNPFNHEQLETLVGFVAGRIVGATDDLIGTVPLPNFAGIQVTDPIFEPRGGYVAVTGAIE